MPSSNRKRAIRELMVEMGTNYTTALRAYDASIIERYAEADAAAAEFAAADQIGSSDQSRSQESASPAASAQALNLQFSHSPGAEVEADSAQ